MKELTITIKNVSSEIIQKIIRVYLKKHKIKINHLSDEEKKKVYLEVLKQLYKKED